MYSVGRQCVDTWSIHTKNNFCVFHLCLYTSLIVVYSICLRDATNTFATVYCTRYLLG